MVEAAANASVSDFAYATCCSSSAKVNDVVSSVMVANAEPAAKNGG